MRIDPTSEAPLFAQVAASVRADAAAGRLVAALGVHLHTVLRAYQVLRQEGLIDMRRGRGAVVTDAVEPLARLHDDVVTLAARARALGLSPDTLASLIKES